jgi:hypothetical protein
MRTTLQPSLAGKVLTEPPLHPTPLDTSEEINAQDGAAEI